MQLIFVDKWTKNREKDSLLCDIIIPSWCNLMLWDNNITRSYASVIPPTSTDDQKSPQVFYQIYLLLWTPCTKYDFCGGGQEKEIQLFG